MRIHAVKFVVLGLAGVLALALARSGACATGFDAERPYSVAGLAVQVNEGGAAPSAELLKAFLPQGQTVRDSLGWHRIETERGRYVMPDAIWSLYTTVASVGGRNVVTLFSGNKLYGMGSNFDFPTSPEQIEAFANFAGWVVRNDGAGKPDARAANIPSLYAVTIWNEFNGEWHGTIDDPKMRPEAMAALLNVVVPKIRAANPSVHIAAGAFIGFQGLARWFQDIGRHFDWRTVDWLDIHPYIGGLKDKPIEEWARQIALLRAGDPRRSAPPITNPAYYSEWGGPASVHYTKAHEGDPGAQSYFDWFADNIIKPDPVAVAGGNYFTLFSSAKFPKQGLASDPSAAGPPQITPLGKAFVERYLR